MVLRLAGHAIMASEVMMGDASENTFRDFIRQQRDSRNLLVTAVMGVMGAAILGVVSAGLIVWRDQSLHAQNVSRIQAEVVKLESGIVELQRLVGELRLAIGVLEARGRVSHPEHDYAPALSLDPRERRDVMEAAAAPGPPGN